MVGSPSIPVSLKSFKRLVHVVNKKQHATPMQGGGLALLCKANCSVDVQSYSENHIDAIVDHGFDDA
uniref:Uncharacterized protein n=1 Tax=Quercus lobata TaxID=97700 RepID=A0A7N2M8W1_QUELO